MYHWAEAYVHQLLYLTYWMKECVHFLLPWIPLNQGKSLQWSLIELIWLFVLLIYKPVNKFQSCLEDILSSWIEPVLSRAGPRSAVGNVSGYRCVSDCRSRGREFDPGPVPYFRGDWSWNDFYGHSPPFRWFIQEGLLSVTSESMCTNYWLTACSSLPRKKCC